MGLSKAIWLPQMVLAFFYLYVAGKAYEGVIPGLLLGERIISYSLFLAPGIAIMQALLASSSATAIIWIDRRMGMLEQILVMPFSRTQYLLSKLLVTMVQLMLIASVVLILALPLGVRPSMQGLLTVSLGLWLLALFLSSLSLLLATWVRTNEAFNALLSLLITPLMFTSSVFYPWQSAPALLQPWMRLNPLTGAAELLRSGLFQMPFPVFEFLALAAQSFSTLIAVMLVAHKIKT
jgi:ABC-2 type transport system permease protein